MYSKILVPFAKTVLMIRNLFHPSQLDGTIRFIVYHSVMPRNENMWVPENNIWADDFEEQLNLINSSDFEVISMGEALDIMQSKSIGNRRLICITFDDGYRNNLTVAWPLLKKYKFPAHFALTAEAIGINEPYHWDIWQKGNEKCEYPGNIADDLLPLSQQEIKKLIAQGATIGSHGFGHRDLTHLSEQELIRELTLSRQKLEFITEKKVNTFVYPFGSFNQLVLKQIQKSYEWGFSVKLGRIQPHRKFDKYIIYRTSTLNKLPLKQFKDILYGGYDFVRIKDKLFESLAFKV